MSPVELFGTAQRALNAWNCSPALQKVALLSAGYFIGPATFLLSAHHAKVFSYIPTMQLNESMKKLHRLAMLTLVIKAAFEITNILSSLIMLTVGAGVLSTAYKILSAEENPIVSK